MLWEYKSESNQKSSSTVTPIDFTVLPILCKKPLKLEFTTLTVI